MRPASQSLFFRGLETATRAPREKKEFIGGGLGIFQAGPPRSSSAPPPPHHHLPPPLNHLTVSQATAHSAEEPDSQVSLASSIAASSGALGSALATTEARSGAAAATRRAETARVAASGRAASVGRAERANMVVARRRRWAKKDGGSRR